MAQCGFLFDFIVVRIDVPNQQLDEQKLLEVDAVFNNIPLKITPSRINVVEFKPRRSYEFDSTAADLKRDLSVCPLRLKVFYDSMPIGSAEVPWNECFLDRIKNDMGEFTHIDECDLFDSAEERVGTIEYICRLQCKCEEPSEDYCSPNVRNDLKKYVNSVIDPNDVLFVVSEPYKEDVCNVPTNENGETPCDMARPTTALDLSPYRILNGRLVQNADAINTCQNIECCDLMKTSQQYQKLMDSLSPSSKKKKGSNRMCQAYKHVDECPHGMKFSSHTDSSSEVSFEFNFGDTNRSKSPMPNVCGLDMPVPDEAAQIFKTPRNCPICKEDVRWLPKLAACPKCGYKPVPVFIEKPHNEDITAEQILEEYLEKRSSASDNDYPPKSCERKTECRCTCVKGKICANCRVRKLCGDIIEPSYGEEETCGKCDDETEDLYRLCTTSSKDCRPHLARVFSELKDLFDATSSKPEQERINEKCERQLHPPVDNNKKRAAPSLRETGGSPARSNNSCVPCDCTAPLKKRKRYRKKRSQLGASRAICRPPPCEQSNMSREELMLKFHDACIDHRRNVPGNMGWLWNANPELGPRWRPGAIRKPVKEIMRYFLRDFPADTIPISRYSYRRNHGKGDNRIEEEEDLIQHPTLHICKKNGEIFITLRPLKSAEALKYCANPYMDMKPITFKIVKNPLAAEVGKMKQCLKEMGFSKCTCNKPIVECFCRSFLDKKRLEYQMKKECRKRGLEEFYDTLRLSDSSDSEVEYDFSVTPPAGLIKRDRLRRPDKINVGTQYEQCDWNPPPMFPLPPNTYMKWINCATGHKYANRRASDLLTIGQKEAIICKQKKAEEAALRKAQRFKKKGKKGAEKPKAEGKQEEPVQECPDGTKVNMRKHVEGKKKK